MNHRQIALITDSTCDIPQRLIEQHDIIVVPFYVVWGEETFRDRVDMQPSAFYRRLVEDSEYPTTSYESPEGFLAVFGEAVNRGAEEIVVITLSSALSGGFEAATQASKAVEQDTHVVDSKGTTMSLGWQVLAAASTREAGGDARAMVAGAEQVRERVILEVSLDTLEYLHKGGRIGGAAKLIGSLLNVKPIVMINHESGEVEAGARVRTRKRGLETLYTRFFDQMDTQGRMHIAVMHGDAPDDAARMADRIEREYDPDELLVEMTGPVLGVHTGPGAIALAGYSE